MNKGRDKPFDHPDLEPHGLPPLPGPAKCDICSVPSVTYIELSDEDWKAIQELRPLMFSKLKHPRNVCKMCRAYIGETLSYVK